MSKKHKRINLHRGHVIYGLIAVFVIFILYSYVDKTAAIFFNKTRHTSWYSTFDAMQYSVNILASALPYAYIYLIVMLCIRRFFYFEQFIFVAITSIFFSSSLTNLLKVVFGRYWTETFTKDNLSLVRTGTYGFDFFHGDAKHASFPSGHTTVIFAAMTVVWIMYPKLRWFSVLMCSIVIVGLLGCDFHFPSDIAAGGFIGSMSAIIVIHMVQTFIQNVEGVKVED